MKIPFTKIRARLTGFSTPFGGVEWEYVILETPTYDAERDTITSLLTFLEDRRVLYGSYAIEEPEAVTRSVQQIRERLSTELEKLEGDAFPYDHLAAMRLASRKFLDYTQRLRIVQKARSELYLPPWASSTLDTGYLFSALGELRAIFGVHIAQLAVHYQIDIEEHLASILPYPPEADQ